MCLSAATLALLCPALIKPSTGRALTLADFGPTVRISEVEAQEAARLGKAPHNLTDAEFSHAFGRVALEALGVHGSPGPLSFLIPRAGKPCRGTVPAQSPRPVRPTASLTAGKDWQLSDCARCAEMDGYGCEEHQRAARR